MRKAAPGFITFLLQASFFEDSGHKKYVVRKPGKRFDDKVEILPAYRFPQSKHGDKIQFCESMIRSAREHIFRREFFHANLDPQSYCRKRSRQQMEDDDL